MERIGSSPRVEVAEPVRGSGLESSLQALPRRVFAVLLAVGMTLTLLGVPAALVDFEYAVRGEADRPVFVQLFELNTEGGVATWFSSAQILLAAGIALVIAVWHRKNHLGFVGHWAGLVGLLLFVSLDEVVQIHEKVGAAVQGALGTSGIFEFAWVIPYGLGLLVVGALYLRFWFGLPRRMRWLFVLAASLYVIGALGMELAEGYWVTYRGWGRGLRALIVLEECLEMVGMSVFVYALGTYLRDGIDARSAVPGPGQPALDR